MNINNAMETREYENGLMSPVLSPLEFQQLLGRYKRAVYTKWVYSSFEPDTGNIGQTKAIPNQSLNPLN
ncbi:MULTISPECIES: hypothetical protein [unclassified Spirosoma]|uniref:hypothetical protein n=1 Tax=unclassified Spirosoma TaxID=2621999 RepID=UPI0009683976|nr:MULTISPECIES: hypothetical protein [unclassified Spirosoma]MBN8821578.1 hypothetical protein [Spirosoma sp.]OJW78350.1 MAG: hypothetical protein BGO59_30555 [Spirosoma sp. 48-14]